MGSLWANYHLAFSPPSDPHTVDRLRVSNTCINDPKMLLFGLALIAQIVATGKRTDPQSICPQSQNLFSFQLGHDSIGTLWISSWLQLSLILGVIQKKETPPMGGGGDYCMAVPHRPL